MLYLEDKIGEVAGKVWKFLEKEGKSSITGVNDAVAEPRSRVNMALGWLAREGKVNFQSEGRGVSVELS